MDFFQRVGNFFNGSGWVSDEEKRRKKTATTQPTSQASKPRDTFQNNAVTTSPVKPSTSPFVLEKPKQVQVPTANPVKPVAKVATPVGTIQATRESAQALTGQAVQKPQAAKVAVNPTAKPVSTANVKPNATRDIQAIYQSKLPSFIKQEEKQREGIGLFGRITDTKWKERAERNAMNSAIAEYRDKTGTLKGQDTKVDDLQRGVNDANVKASKESQKIIDNTKKAVDVARLVPGAGIGEWGANMVRQATGNQTLEQLISEQFDIPLSQVNQLSPQDKDKYGKIAQAGLFVGAAVDSIPIALGTGQVARQGAKNLQKITIKNLVKNMLTKQGARDAAINAGVGGGLSSGISYGATLATGGDQKQAFESAAQGFLPGVAGGLIGRPADVAEEMTRNAGRATRSAVVNSALKKNVRNTNIGESLSRIDAEDNGVLPSEIDIVPGTRENPVVEEQPVVNPQVEAQKNEVTTRAQQEVESVVNNPNLTPEQKRQRVTEIQEQTNDVLARLDQSARNTEQLVQGQGEQFDADAAARAATNEQTQAEQAAATERINSGNSDLGGDEEVRANDAYGGRSLNEFEAEQQRRTNAAQENPIQRLLRRAKEQLYDPFAELQRVDEKGAVGNDSLVSLMQRTLQPQKAVQVRLKREVVLPNGHKDSVWNIIKKYGKTDSQKAQEFANYRMYKDELWRITDGRQEPALNINPQDMAEFVIRYERQHPDAVLDNAVLREFSLQNLRERADAGIDSQAMYEASAKNPFYAPRTRANGSNKDLQMAHSGGFTTTSKSTQARTGADIAVSPLDLYRMDAQNTEVGVLRNLMGQNFYNRALNGEEGFEVDVDPQIALQHRQSREAFDSARQDLLDAREIRDTIKADRAMSKQELASVEAKATKMEDQAVEKMRAALQKATGNPDDVLFDLTTRDPRYDVELKMIKSPIYRAELKSRGLTPGEIRSQVAYDIRQLNQRYPDPNITTRQELLDLANSLNSGMFTAADMAKQAKTVRQQIPDLEQRLDALTGMQNQARQNVSEADAEASRAWQDLIDTTQSRDDWDGNVWTFKIDGEAGKGTTPAGIAAEISRLRKFADTKSSANLLLRATQALGTVVKATWTGAFAPVWQTLNVAKNFGLMLNNGKWLSALSPSAMKGFVEGIVPISPATREFINQMKSRGASYEDIVQSAAVRNMAADDIAARANIGTFLLRNPVHTFKDLYHMTSTAFTHVANAQRNAVAYNAYKRAIDAGVPEAKALDMAANEINKVFGDLQRVSELAQAMEPLIPYAGATQAGVRALVNKAKESPAEFAVKQAAIISAGIGLTLYSMQNNAQYYQDQIDKGYTTDLDNNYVVVLPGATRDENGNWSGVVKIPLTPDFRPINRAAWRSTYDLVNGQGVNPGLVAGELFNEFTGDMANNIYDQKVAETAGTPVAGLFTGSPVLNVGKILSGVNPTTGAPLSDSDMALRPRTEQAYDSTSNAAQGISNITQGAVTPIQADKLLSQLGGTGRAIRNDDPEQNFFAKMFDFQNALYGGKGMTDKQRDTQQYFDNVEEVSKSIDPNDKKTLKEFQALHSKKTAEQKDNLLNSATKANQFMQYIGDGSFQTTALFDAEKKMDELQRSQGQPGNPLFELPVQELQKVLMYRSLKAANSAGQNYTKNGESAFQSLGLDEKWYQDFRDAESQYYKDLGLSGDDSANTSFSGKDAPALTDEQRTLQSQYFALPAKSQERRDFLTANPWLKDYWASDNDFTDEERKSMGFNSLNESGSGYGYGSGGGYGTDTLIRLANYADSIKRLDPQEAAKLPEIQTLLKKLIAGSGGRDKPTLGASSRGDV